MLSTGTMEHLFVQPRSVRAPSSLGRSCWVAIETDQQPDCGLQTVTSLHATGWPFVSRLLRPLTTCLEFDHRQELWGTTCSCSGVVDKPDVEAVKPDRHNPDKICACVLSHCDASGNRIVRQRSPKIAEKILDCVVHSFLGRQDIALVDCHATSQRLGECPEGMRDCPCGFRAVGGGRCVRSKDR